MDPLDFSLLLGVGLIGVLIYRQQRSDSNFTGFMDSIGGSDVPDLVPVAEGDVSGGASNSGGVIKSIQDWAQAVFHVEGGRPGDRNVRNNNPGNLKAAPDVFTGSTTARDSGGFVIFPSLDAGWQALYAQLSMWLNESPSLTLNQFYAKYLGQADYLTPRVTAEGDPFAAAKKVADQLGVDPNQTIGSIFGGH